MSLSMHSIPAALLPLLNATVCRVFEPVQMLGGRVDGYVYGGGFCFFFAFLLFFFSFFLFFLPLLSRFHSLRPLSGALLWASVKAVRGETGVFLMLCGWFFFASLTFLVSCDTSCPV
jgi:hypothetical protein